VKEKREGERESFEREIPHSVLGGLLIRRRTSSRMHVGVEWRDGLEDRAINCSPTAHRLRITKDGLSSHLSSEKF
jgi:hypothetical protein